MVETAVKREVMEEKKIFEDSYQCQPGYQGQRRGTMTWV